jgi:O-antigen/teichoic acid export membrane protein
MAVGLPLTNILSDRARRLSKEGFWVIVGQGIAVLGSLIGVRLLTEALEPTAYGELALGMTVATLVNQTVLGPLGVGAIRFYSPACENSDFTGYLRAVRSLGMMATCIIVAMWIILVIVLMATRHARWSVVAAASLAFAVVSGYNAILNGIQNAARQRSIVALHQGAESWARYLIAAGLAALIGATSAVAMTGYVLSGVLVLASQLLFFRKITSQMRSVGAVENDWQRRIWKFSWPISVFGIFTWGQLASDRWALGLLSTTRDVGMYAALLQLGYYPVSMATGVAVQFLTPILFQRVGDASDASRNANAGRLTWRLTGLALALTCVAFVVTFVLHAQIFRTFAAREYGGISYLLPWMILAGGIFAAAQVAGLNLMSRMKTRKIMVAKIATSLVGIALNFAGARWLGVAGIVAATLIFSTLHFLSIALLNKSEGIG